MKTGVLLVNLGTPNDPETGSVRKYLTQFLNDPRVIDISPLGRFFLVNFLIVPFRSPKSAKLYKEIWTEKGSPLLEFTSKLSLKLQKELGDGYFVDFAMRYQNPSLEKVLAEFEKKEIKKLKIIPLYPQYASSSTGSTNQRVMEIISKWEVIPDIEIISQFFDNIGYINAFAEIGKKYNPDSYDHVLFSFHGLPERQIKKADKSNSCLNSESCCNKINSCNYYCYRATSFATARSIAEKMELSADKYSVSFQSRLGKDPWIKPYSDHVIEQKAKTGVKKMLVFSPAFVADCLETIYEIGVEYQEIFKRHGGEHLQFVESLNDNPIWVDALKEMVLDK